MRWLQNLCYKLAKHQNRFSASQLALYHKLIINYDALSMQPKKILCLNSRQGVQDILKDGDFECKYLEIFNNKVNTEDPSSSLIKAWETLSNINDKYDIIIIDSCLQNMLRPLDLLANAVKIASQVVIVVKNYSNFKHRVNFLASGNRDLFDENINWYNTPCVRPFGIRDFLDTCSKNHFFVRHAFYMAKNGSIKEIFKSMSIPNIYLDEAVFIISDL